MTITLLRCAMSGLLAAAVLASSGLAAPAILDRIPASSGPILAVSSLKTLDENAGQLMASIEFPAADSISELLTVMGLADGLNMNGSAAVVWPQDAVAEALGGGRVLMLIPTTPDGRFLASLGAKPDGDLLRVDYNGATYYARALEPTLLAISATKEIVSNFTLEKGRSAERLAAVGQRGRTIADEADILLLAAGDGVRPVLDLAMTPIRQGLASASMVMGRPTGGAPAEMSRDFVDRVVDQTQAAIIGLRTGPLGARVDLFAEFKEGSELAGLTAGRHDSPDLIAAMPRREYLLLASTDLSHPVMRALIGDAIARPADAVEQPTDPLRLMQAMDAGAVAMYAPAGALMTEGVLTSTVVTWQADQPAQAARAFRRLLETTAPAAGNGADPAGKAGFSYTPGALTLADTQIDSWTVWPDPARPGASNPFLTGQTPGMRGYIATSGTRGFITTGHNQSLLTDSIRPRAGQTLADDLMLTQINEMLPSRAAVRWAINLKPLLQQAAPMIRMFTRSDLELPDELPPIAGALALEDGGLHGGMYLPAPLLKVAVTVYRAQQERAR